MTTAKAASSSGTLGGVWKNGIRRVRITKITRVWVASDSTNQPVWNRTGPAWNTHSMMPEDRKSNTELSGPEKSMNLRMKPRSQRVGWATSSGSTSSVGMASWLVSYSRLFSRIWEGSVGREGEETQ